MKKILTLLIIGILSSNCTSQKTIAKFDKEIKKWKQELYDSGKVGSPCRDDKNWDKWMQDNPDYYYGMQKIKSIETDYNSDGMKDVLFYFPAINCVGGNGYDSDFAMLIYSKNEKYITNKKITNTIETKIKTLLSEKGINNVYDIKIFYKGFTKTIIGQYYAWTDDDAHCCPSNSGIFEYNPKDLKLTIKNKTKNY